MKNSNLLLLMFLLISYCCKSDISEDSEKEIRPNVVMVLVDDLRWDEFGLGGHNYIKTPNIDRMVREGVHFVNAFATTPLCSPSRASFLTGQYAHTHGVVDNTDRSERSHQLETFPVAMEKEGYKRAFIGKWHMGNDNSPRPGFDFWMGLKGQGEAIDPGFNINGNEKVIKGYVTDILTEYSLQFIEENKSEPFLLYLSHKGLHPNLHQSEDGTISKIGAGGFIAAKRHQGMYQDSVFERRPNAFVTPIDKPALMKPIPGLPELGEETGTPESVIRERAEMLMAIDEGLGLLFEKLESAGILDNTLIVFAGDHGYFYGEHGLNEERRLHFEETMRIPLMMRYPPLISPGTEITQMVLNIDVAPTILDLSGVSVSNQMEGKSLSPLFNKERFTEDWRESFLVEYYSDKVWPRMVNLGYKAIRTNRYKYIRYIDQDGLEEFYDLEKDPYELNNSISNTEYSEKIDELKSLLTTY